MHQYVSADNLSEDVSITASNACVAVDSYQLTEPLQLA